MTREQGRGVALSAFLMAAAALIVFVFIATEGIHKREDELSDLLSSSVLLLARGADRHSPALLGEELESFLPSSASITSS
jgi:hypothetical protein